MAMDGDEAFKPTLLIGVGGTGCEIAEKVYSRALASAAGRAGRIAVLGFDTDANDMRRLGVLERRRQVRFSTADTVHQLVKKNPEIEAGWFGPMARLPQEIKNMTLLDGAGQIRLLTRLGLYHALKSGTARRQIEETISSLGVLNSRDRFDGSVNVMFVGSLAGATGSGSFLQLALLVAAICKGQTNVELSALFLLPDAFVKGAALPSGQIENVLANGYAALKELNAITGMASGRSGHRGLDFEIAPNLFVEPGSIPFRSVAFIDFENIKGGNLGSSLAAYKDMAANAAYLLIFTPIGQKAASTAVNDARSKMAAAAAGTYNLYAGIGVSAVDYPAHEMADYLAAKLAIEMLAGDWLRLDRQYYARVRNYDEQRRAGNLAATLIDQGEAYLQDLGQLATQDRIPFFAEIHGKLYPKTRQPDGSETVNPLHETYLDSLLKQIMQRFWDRERLALARARGQLDSDQLKNLEALPGNVRNKENELDDDLSELDKALAIAPEEDFRNLLLTADDLSEAEWRDYHLQSYIIKGGPHLVQVRAFLAALRRSVGARLALLKVADRRSRLMRLASVFDDERGKDPASRRSVKTLEMARDVASRNMIGRVFKGGPKAFQEQFATYYNASLEAMRRLGDESVTARVYELVLDEVAALERQLGGLFVELGSVFEKLEKTAAFEERRHAAGSGLIDGRVHVYADEAAKRQVWALLSEQSAGLKLGADANRSLAANFYKRFRDARRQRKVTEFIALGEEFRHEIVDVFARGSIERDFRSFYDFSVIEAVRREAARTGIDWKTYLRRQVDLVSAQSEPFVTLADPNDGQRVIFWAISPSVRGEINDDDVYNSLFTFQQGEAPLALPEFSAYELLCMNNRVNLELSQFAKLHPGSEQKDRNVASTGRYYEAYRRMAESLLEAEINPNKPSRHFTPHIDINWHRPGALPEITPELNRKQRSETYRAYAAALGAHFLEFVTEFGEQVADLVTIGKVQAGGMTARVEKTWDRYAVLQAFERRADLIRSVSRAWAEFGERMRTDQPLAARLLQQFQDAGLLRDILQMAVPRADLEAREERTQALLVEWAMINADVLRFAQPNSARPVLDKEFERAVEQSRAGAFAALADTGVAPETQRSLMLVFGKALEVARSARQGG